MIDSPEMKIIHPITFSALALLTIGLNSLQGTQPLQDLRALTLEWVALEQSISKEALAWEEKKRQLNDFIQIAKAEVEQLQEERVSLEQSNNLADTQREELLDQQTSLEQHSQIIESFLPEIETELKRLRPLLPQPLLAQLQTAYRKIPAAQSSTSLGIAERMQTVMGILTSIQRFDDGITVIQEVKTLPDQSKGEVTTVYLGLATGYYVTTAGNDAGYGVPTPDGWVWQSDPSLASAINKAIAIANGTSPSATFIQLPITLK